MWPFGNSEETQERKKIEEFSENHRIIGKGTYKIRESTLHIARGETETIQYIKRTDSERVRFYADIQEPYLRSRYVSASSPCKEDYSVGRKVCDEPFLVLHPDEIRREEIQYIEEYEWEAFAKIDGVRRLYHNIDTNPSEWVTNVKEWDWEEECVAEYEP